MHWLAHGEVLSWPQGETLERIALAVLCAEMLFPALTILAVIPEIPTGNGFKPFLNPLAFVAWLPRGRPALAAAPA